MTLPVRGMMAMTPRLGDSKLRECPAVTEAHYDHFARLHWHIFLRNANANSDWDSHSDANGFKLTSSCNPYLDSESHSMDVEGNVSVRLRSSRPGIQVTLNFNLKLNLKLGEPLMLLSSGSTPLKQAQL